MTNKFDFSTFTDSELTLELISRSRMISNSDGIVTFYLDSGIKVFMKTKVFNFVLAGKM